MGGQPPTNDTPYGHEDHDPQGSDHTVESKKDTQLHPAQGQVDDGCEPRSVDELGEQQGALGMRAEPAIEPGKNAAETVPAVGVVHKVALGGSREPEPYSVGDDCPQEAPAGHRPDTEVALPCKRGGRDDQGLS